MVLDAGLVLGGFVAGGALSQGFTNREKICGAHEEEEPAVTLNKKPDSPKKGKKAVRKSKYKACLIGSGNWGTAVASVIGNNVLSYPEFEDELPMYVYEERVEVDGQKALLSEVINERHENVKYLPGVKLPTSVKAVPDLRKTVEGCDILIWVVPHQFVGRLIDQIKDVISKDAFSVSLIKGGMEIKDGDIELCSELIRKRLGTDCSVLMGANMANEVATGQFCEATIGYKDETYGDVLLKLFDAPNFRIRLIEDVEGVELCGALKNIVALAAGFSDGMGWGTNTKSAIMRAGLAEMAEFSRKLYPDSKGPTFMESCGFADLITTCLGGRNRKCAEAFVAEGKSWDVLQAELLKGRKLQGTVICEEIVSVVKKRRMEKDFPFIMGVYRVAFEGANPAQFCQAMMKRDPMWNNMNRIG